MGQALSLLVFTSVTVSGSELSYRVTAIIATVCCVIGAALFFLYNEKSVMSVISSAEKDGEAVQAVDKTETAEVVEPSVSAETTEEK